VIQLGVDANHHLAPYRTKYVHDLGNVEAALVAERAAVGKAREPGVQVNLGTAPDAS
jgi:hypothetical protein